MQILLVFVVLVVFCRQTSSSFVDVTEKVGIAGINGYLAAFGDLNSDKQTDLFVVTDGGKSLDVFMWLDQAQEFRKGRARITLSNDIIVNVSPSDFDGDGQLDVMIATVPENDSLLSPKTVYVLWGNLQTLVKPLLSRHLRDLPKCPLNGGCPPNRGSNVSFTMSDQPLVMDANGDLLPDLFGMVEDENTTVRTYWISKGLERDFKVQLQVNDSKKQEPIRIPHSNAFLDLTGDFTSDLFITTKDLKFELWKNKDGTLMPPTQSFGPPIEVITHIGQSSFADIDGDGNIDHLLPICTTSECEESHIFVQYHEQWQRILSNVQLPLKWKLIPPSSDQSSLLFPLMTIRIGDYNMDGFPDAVVVLAVDINGDQSFKEVPVLLENVPCKDENCFNGRTISVHLEALISLEGAVLATFFDLYEDGKNGILVVTRSYTDESPQYQLHAVRNDLYTDTSFLKVIVLGGQCFSSCPKGNLPYGVNQVGPFIKYSTTTTEGKAKLGSAAQLSQSAYFALQCPYTMFGLGRTPNFVDKLTVGMPRGKTSPKRVNSWPSIIPNSQLIVVPYPPDSPSSWRTKLFITPSKLVLLTGVSLLGICVVIGLIILLLHLKEKREDQKEKRQDAHKFHFDAM